MKNGRHLFSVIALAAMVGLAVFQNPSATRKPPTEIAQIENSVTYGGCNEVRALGKAPLHAGEPGYRDTMDGDGDGIACEPIRYQSR